MKRFASILLLIAGAGCASLSPAPASSDGWTYIGNDPDGTQNILMSAVTPVPQHGTLTTTFLHQYTAPRSVTTADGKQVAYVERRDEVRVNCLNQSLTVLGKRYYDVEEQQVFSKPARSNQGTQRVIPGGIDDVMYQAVCGRSIGWDDIGSSADKRQQIAIMGKAATRPVSGTVEAWFRTRYDGAQSLIAGPTLRHVTYSSKISTLEFNCATFEVGLLHEVYYDTDNHKVFDIQPGDGEAAEMPATADSVRGLMFRAACGRPTELRYLGMDPHHTQKVYMVGAPTLLSRETASARFHFYYLKPGTLTTGPVIRTVAYDERRIELDADCSALTYQVRSEAYLDNKGVPVFTITPPADAAPDVDVTPDSLSEMLWKTACHGAG